MFLLALLIIATSAAMSTAEAQDSTSGASASVRFAASVDLVTLPITVRDAKGRPASDLHQQDFAVYENGARQSIRIFRHEDISVTVGLVIDHSGSMRPKMADVIAAARTFVTSSNPEDEMFVVTFNERVNPGFAGAVHFANSFDQLESVIRKTPLGGQTALYDAIFQAQEQVLLGSREKKALIVISDGGDNASSHTLAEVLKSAGHSTAVIYAIGIFDSGDPDRNPDILRRLAHATGGEAYFPTLPDGIIATCEGIARDMRSQYLIGYVPSPAAQQAGYRTIRVTAHAAARGKLSVRTRAGYFAAGSAHLKDQASQ
jgi:Ca-activated chloride channel homolog